MTVPATPDNENTLFDGLVDSVTCRYFRKKRFSAARTRRECAARKTKRTRSTTTEETVRKQCATVRISGEPGMNAQDDTLQNVTGLRFRGRKDFLRSTATY